MRIDVRLWAIASVVLVAVFGSAAGQCLDWMDGLEEGEGGANQGVAAVVGGELGGVKVAFIGGSFYIIGGVYSEGMVAWDGETWTPIDDWYRGWAQSLAWFDDGGGPALFAAGGFIFEEGEPRANVVRYRNGVWEDLDAQMGTASFYAAVEHDGKLFIAGGFSSVAGQPTNGLAAWDGESWQAFPDGPNAPIYALASFDDGAGPALIVGGGFSEAGGVAASKVASYRDGVWSQVGDGLSGGHCRALCVVDSGQSTLYAGGDFLWSGGDRVTRIARWNGESWERLGGNANTGGGVSGEVEALGTTPGQFFPVLVVAGTFGGPSGGPNLRNAATWDGFSWDDLRGGIETTGVLVAASAETEQGPRLIFGGSISDQGGKPAKHVAIWGVPCSAPTFFESPVDLTAPFDDFVEFTAHAHGSMPLEYAWTRDGVPLVDDNRINGVDSTRLTIHPWNFDDGGVYECWATNEFGWAVSDPAVLTIPGGGLPPVVVETLTLTEIEGFDDPNRFVGLFAKSVALDGGIAIYAGNGYGERHVLAWRDGSLERVLSLGDPMPGAQLQEVITELSARPVAGLGNRLAFHARISGPEVTPDDDTVVCVFDGIELRTVLREGDQAMGMAAGVTIAEVNFYFNSMSFGDGGTLLINNHIRGNGFDQEVDLATWRWTLAGGFELVAYSGQIAPGGDVPWLGSIGSFGPGDAERISLLGAVDSTTGYQNFPGPDRGIWVEQGGEIVKVVKGGDPAPGFPADVNFEIFNSHAVLPSETLFSSRVAGPNGFDSYGLWAWNGTDTVPVLIEGDALPSGPPEPPSGAGFNWPNRLRGNANGATLFYSTFESDCGSSCSDRGVFLRLPDGRLLNALLEKMPALRGMEPELSLEGVGATTAINSRNQIVIQVGFGTTIGGIGLVGWDPVRGLFPILVPGTRIEVEPGQPRVVLNATLPVSYDPDPLTATGLTEDGSVIASIEFTDWPGAIVRTSWTEARDAYFPCRADINADGAVNTRDVIRFLNLWAAGDWGADFSDDGRIDTRDVIAFLDAWAAGCL